MITRRLYITRDTRVGDLLEGVAVSGALSYYSLKMCPSPEGLISFILRWTGTPTGTFTLWFSNKDVPDETSDTDWVQDATWAPTNPAGAASKAAYAIGNLSHRWVRVKYTNSASTGTIFGEQGK